MIIKDNFNTVLKENNIIETNTCKMYYVNKVENKISSKGISYKLINSIDRNINRKIFYYFNLKSKLQPEQNKFMYCKILAFGNNFKVDEIYKICNNIKQNSNENELVNVNDYFEINSECVEFWKEYDSKRKR